MKYHKVACNSFTYFKKIKSQNESGKRHVQLVKRNCLANLYIYIFRSPLLDDSFNFHLHFGDNCDHQQMNI